MKFIYVFCSNSRYLISYLLKPIYKPCILEYQFHYYRVSHSDYVRECEKRFKKKKKMNKITQITQNILLGRSSINVEGICPSLNGVKSFDTEEYDEVDSAIVGNKLK